MVKTYYVSRLAGEVKRLDEFTLPWVDVSVPAVTNIFQDIMAFPDDPEKVIVVGKQNGIYYSVDSGGTWNPSVGTYTALGAGNEWYEVWIASSLVSYAVGNESTVVKSVDGGVTYDITPTYPSFGGAKDPDLNATCVHFIDENIGVVGTSAIVGGTYIWKTIDGGATWSILNGGFELNFDTLIGGVHLSADQQTIVAITSNGIYRSTDAGVSFTLVQDIKTFAANSGIHLTWISDTELWATGLNDQVWKTDDGGATWNIIRNYNPALGSVIGAHFYDSNNGYLGGGDGSSIYVTTDGGNVTTLSELNTTVHAIWTEFGGFTPCYTLVDCAGEASPIYTATDLSGFVGQVISLADTDGSEMSGCWSVTENPVPCIDPTDVTVYKCYDQCSDCLPPAPPTPTPKPRKVDPGYDTGLCSPEIVEKAFCTYADMVYADMLTRRYMIKDCCPKDEMAVTLEYEKVRLLLTESADPTPDQCNPLCLAYSITIQPGDSAITTYVDCDGVDQTITTPISEIAQVVAFCALNTTPPVTIVTHDDASTDSYVLQSYTECELPIYHNYRITLSANFDFTGQYFTYTDSFGQPRQIDLGAIGKSDVIYEVCAVHGSLLLNGTDSLFISGDVPECGACATVNGINIVYLGDC